MVPVAAGSSHESAFTAKDVGAWRLRYLVAFGCTEGKPLSEADCTSQITIYSPQFQVSGGSQDNGCVESGGIVKTSLCCRGIGDFPSTCAVGACGCSPENSHISIWRACALMICALTAQHA